MLVIQLGPVPRPDPTLAHITVTPNSPISYPNTQLRLS